MTLLEPTAASTVPGSRRRLDRNVGYYELASRGDGVRADFRRMGWSFTPSQGDARLFADHIVISHVELSRIWSSAGVRTSDPGEGRVLVVGAVEGTLTIETPLRSKVLAHDQLAVLDASLGVEIRHRAHIAAYEIGLPAREISVLAHRMNPGDIVLLEHALPDPLVSMLNAMFNERLDVTLPGSAHRRRAVIDLLAATMLDGVEIDVDDDPKPDSRDRLIHDARALIDQHFGDPRFNAATLAKLLYLSRSQLYRVFERHRSTPRTEILERRLKEMGRQLGVDVNTLGEQSGRLFDAALESSGFNSRRSLARAIAALDAPHIGHGDRHVSREDS